MSFSSVQHTAQVCIYPVAYLGEGAPPSRQAATFFYSLATHKTITNLPQVELHLEQAELLKGKRIPKCTSFKHHFQAYFKHNTPICNDFNYLIEAT